LIPGILASAECNIVTILGPVFRALKDMYNQVEAKELTLRLREVIHSLSTQRLAHTTLTLMIGSYHISNHIPDIQVSSFIEYHRDPRQITPQQTRPVKYMTSPISLHVHMA